MEYQKFKRQTHFLWFFFPLFYFLFRICCWPFCFLGFIPHPPFNVLVKKNVQDDLDWTRRIHEKWTISIGGKRNHNQLEEKNLVFLIRSKNQEKRRKIRKFLHSHQLDCKKITYRSHMMTNQKVFPSVEKTL